MADQRARWRPTPFLIASAGIHGAALSSLIVSPQSWQQPLAVVIVNHLAISTVSMLPRCGWLGPNLTRISSERAKGSLIALTFDDGPDPAVTPRVLDLLDRAGMRATFFCIGERAEAHPDLIRTMRDRGHGIENHSYSHPNSFALYGPGAMRREVIRAQDGIEQAAGRRPQFFRAPAGMQNPWLAAVLASAGVSLVSWTRRGFDTVSDDGLRVAGRLTRGLTAGDILLLHDGHAAGPMKRPQVIDDALSAVLDEMHRKGLRSEALHAISGTPSE